MNETYCDVCGIKCTRRQRVGAKLCCPKCGRDEYQKIRDELGLGKPKLRLYGGLDSYHPWGS